MPRQVGRSVETSTLSYKQRNSVVGGFWKETSTPVQAGSGTASEASFSLETSTPIEPSSGTASEASFSHIGQVLGRRRSCRREQFVG